mmetsp:Transcript_12232/g.37319  ORF Transcript_12232/g.37319 Transcript_12232/m.37319 type:complete len:572 (+) Transcript_12232:60-1775(+)
MAETTRLAFGVAGPSGLRGRTACTRSDARLHTGGRSVLFRSAKRARMSVQSDDRDDAGKEGGRNEDTRARTGGDEELEYPTAWESAASYDVTEALIELEEDASAAGTVQAPSPENGNGEQQSLNRRIATMAFPAMASLLVEPVFAMVDTAFVGRIGTAQLAGVGISSFILKGSATFFSLFMPITTSMVAVANGPEEKSPIIWQSLVLALLIGSLSAVVLHVSAYAGTSALAGAASAASVPFGVSYMQWRSLGMPVLIASFVLSGAFRGMQDTVSPLKSAVAANLVNIVLDYVFIFHFGWGVAGAAIATVASQLTNFAVMMLLALRKDMLRLADFSVVPQAKVLKEFMAGSVLTVRTFGNIVTFTIASKLAATVGTAAVAAFEVSKQIWSFQVLSIGSLNVAAQGLVAAELGKGNHVGARNLADRLLLWGFILGCSLVVFSLVLAGPIPHLFSRDPKVAEVATSLIRTFVWAHPFCGVMFTLEGCFVAKKKYNYVTVANLAAAFVSYAAFGFLFKFTNVGLTGVWIGINTLMICRFVALIVKYLHPSRPLLPRGNKDGSARENSGTALEANL